MRKIGQTGVVGRAAGNRFELRDQPVALPGPDVRVGSAAEEGPEPVQEVPDRIFHREGRCAVPDRYRRNLGWQNRKGIQRAGHLFDREQAGAGAQGALDVPQAEGLLERPYVQPRL